MTKPKSPVFYAPTVDAAMAAASANAQKTFKYLWRELTWEHRRIVKGLELAAVKAGFGDEGGHVDDIEHMWLGDVAFDEDEISATLLNQPNHVRSVRKGDRVTLAPDELDDWMYVMGGKVHGGFTIQAMRKQMSPSDRRAHDTAWGFDFGNPDLVKLVPDWSAKKPGLLGRLFATPAAPTVTDPDVEHPMSENMAAGFARAIDQSPNAFLREAGPDGLTALHSLALGGSAACVRVLLEKGADRGRRTKSGKTALDLAEQMGWPRVVALLRAGH